MKKEEKLKQQGGREVVRHDPVFVFDEENHKYFLDNEQIPGVTEVLDAVGLIPSGLKSEWHALRGLFIHKACHLLAEGKLDWSTVDPRILGYVLAYQKFLEETSVKIIELETPHYDKVFRYAGTPDALVQLPNGTLLLYDIKSGSPALYHALQTAAYQYLVNRKGPMLRGTLLLRPDETYSLRLHRDRTDWNRFLACLTVWQLKREVSLWN